MLCGIAQANPASEAKSLPLVDQTAGRGDTRGASGDLAAYDDCERVFRVAHRLMRTWMPGKDRGQDAKRSDDRPLNSRIRAPLKPVPEGWRRFALLGVFALAVLGVVSAVGSVYLLARLLTAAG